MVKENACQSAIFDDVMSVVQLTKAKAPPFINAGIAESILLPSIISMKVNWKGLRSRDCI